jgi:aminoglycoside N3'-acetyltransferase
MPADAVSVEALTAQLRALGVAPGGVLLVHSSFRAVRPVENGPAGLIAALRAALGPDGTLVMPAWTGDDDAIFDPATTPCPADLGIVAETFRRQPDVVRSTHPMAFAAAGPMAQEAVKGALPLPPHGPESPVGNVHDLDGQVLLIGVGQDANTTLHMAEALAGVPYWSRSHLTIAGPDGRPQSVVVDEPDHCCEGFAKLDDWLAAEGRLSEGPLGHGTARLFRSRDAVRLALQHLARDPLVFLHPPEAGCEDCDAARASIGRAR